MKERKDLQRMLAAMMKVKSPLKRVDPPEASTTSVAKKDKPFSYDEELFKKITSEDKAAEVEEKEKESLKSTIFKAGGSLPEGSQDMSADELRSKFLDRRL